MPESVSETAPEQSFNLGLGVLKHTPGFDPVRSDERGMKGGEYVVIWASSVESIFRVYPSDGQDPGSCVSWNSSIDPLGRDHDGSASFGRILQPPKRFSLGTGSTA